MCIAIIYFPRCYDKKFDINHNQAVFLHAQKIKRQKFQYPENEKAK